MAGTAYWLIGFAISQLVIIAVGMVPLEYWMSFRKTPRPVAA